MTILAEKLRVSYVIKSVAIPDRVTNKNQQKTTKWLILSKAFGQRKGAFNLLPVRELILGNDILRAKLMAGYWSTYWKGIRENELLAFKGTSGEALQGNGPGMFLPIEAINHIRQVSALTCWKDAPWASAASPSPEKKRRNTWDSEQKHCQSLPEGEYTARSWDKTDAC